MRTIKDLMNSRQYMTLDEVLTHLDILKKYSSFESGKKELTLQLPALLVTFKLMLMEYDNSEINIIITNTLNNIVSKNLVKTEKPGTSKCWAIADTATEVFNRIHKMYIRNKVLKIYIDIYLSL